jgi:membrane associated rhomboid family serine protease
MDINQILFLIAVLNLAGDLYNILKFRHQIPGWMLPANIVALCVCIAVRILLPSEAGLVAIIVLACYILAIKLQTRSRAQLANLPSPATKLLIAANVLAYGFQVYRGALDSSFELIRVGALYTPLLELGEWWRLFSAQFLHWGLAHLALNMMGLWFLGPTVEAIVGSVRFTLAYLLCGAGGMAVAWGISYMSPDPRPLILLGASASVLGLVGLQAAYSLKAYRYSGSLVAKAQLASMTQIIVLQAIFDWMVPQVSSTAHMGGAVSGFLLGMFVVRPRRRRVEVMGV